MVVPDDPIVVHEDHERVSLHLLLSGPYTRSCSNSGNDAAKHYPNNAPHMDFPTFYIFVDEDFLAPGGILNGIWGTKLFLNLIFFGFVLPDLQHFRLLDRFRG